MARDRGARANKEDAAIAGTGGGPREGSGTNPPVLFRTGNIKINIYLF